MILGCLFAVLGIMNPAIAKMTPWLLATLADTLSESGLVVTAVTVDAMTSWTQFFKNIPMGLLVFLLLESSIFTEEYQSGTLVLTLTKGFERYKVVLSKSVMLLLLWTACHWSSLPSPTATTRFSGTMQSPAVSCSLPRACGCSACGGSCCQCCCPRSPEPTRVFWSGRAQYLWAST